MKFMRPIFSLLIAAGLATGACGQAQPMDLARFRETKPPMPYTPEWYRLNNGGNDFAVELAGEAFSVYRTRYENAIPWTLGKDSLLCVNYGEFGGGIFYLPADTLHRQFWVNGHPGPSQRAFFGGLMIPPWNPLSVRLKRYQLVCNGNIMAIVKFKDSVYYLTGYSLPGNGRGFLNSLHLANDSFQLAEVADLPDMPLAALADGGRLWIATENALLLYENGAIRRFFDHLWWMGLGPNSMVMGMDGKLYVGLRGGYAAVDVGKGEMVFYEWQ
jgi:hypothetical protein